MLAAGAAGAGGGDGGDGGYVLLQDSNDGRHVDFVGLAPCTFGSQIKLEGWKDTRKKQVGDDMLAFANMYGFWNRNDEHALPYGCATHPPTLTSWDDHPPRVGWLGGLGGRTVH